MSQSKNMKPKPGSTKAKPATSCSSKSKSKGGPPVISGQKDMLVRLLLEQSNKISQLETRITKQEKENEPKLLSG